MRYRALLTLLAIFLTLLPAGCISKGSPHPSAEEPCLSMPQGKITFPKDEYPHDEPIEWYYWTGHLQTEEGRWFGYALVFFVLDLHGQESLIGNPAISSMLEKFGGKVVVLNQAISDIDDGSFHYTGGFACM